MNSVQFVQSPPVIEQMMINTKEVVRMPPMANRNSPNRMPPIFRKAATFPNAFASMYLFLPASTDDYNISECLCMCVIVQMQ